MYLDQSPALDSLSVEPLAYLYHWVSNLKMLDRTSPWQYHFLQNLSLIILSILFLPFSTIILLSSYALDSISRTKASRRRQIRRSPNFFPKTVLVTGVGMSKGLALARTFYAAGHNVIGADFEPYGVPVGGRYSRSLRKFHSLPKPNDHDGSALYIHELLKIVRRHKVDLWISCSGVASAMEDAQAKEVLERRTDCIAIQFDVATTATLHEKHTFIQRTHQLGLPVPETHNVTSRSAVHKVLHSPAASKKKYIMKAVDMDDANRGNMTLLPRRSISETYQHVSKIPISGEKPWVLQQYIRGREYCTHALVIDNVVKMFVACPSLELLMHYEALPASTPLSQAMLRFTQAFATRSEPGLTGHLSFDFLVEEVVSEKGLEMVLQPIECNPRAHTAVMLFRDQSTVIANAYLSVFRTDMNGTAEGTLPSPDTIVTHTAAPAPHERDIITPINPRKYYWLGHDIVALLILPLFDLLLLLVLPFRRSPTPNPTRSSAPSLYLHHIFTFLHHVLFWHDGAFALWDPLPWWWLYHVYWPGLFWASIVQGGKWSRVNVSTGKLFGC